jgi:hypothetical protein
MANHLIFQEDLEFRPEIHSVGLFMVSFRSQRDLIEIPLVTKTPQVQNDSKLLSVLPWPINGNPDNNLESLCKIMFLS